MSEATKETQDTKDLEASVAALMDDAGKSMAPPASPSTPPAGAAPANDFDVDALAAEAVNLLVSVNPQNEAPAPPSIESALEAAAEDLAAAAPVSAAPTEADDLAKAVERLIQEAPPASAEPATTPKKIEALDAQIADLADDLIAGEFADENNVLQGQIGEPPAKEAPPPPVSTEQPMALPTPPPAPEPTPKAEQPVATVEPERPAPPAPKAPTSPGFARAAAKSAAKVAAAHGTKAASRLKPLVIKVLELISSPLSDKPKYIRDLVGWLALWTLFVSISLWGYVLFFRSAKPPEVVTPVAAAESESAKSEGGHGESKSGHGEKKDAKPDKAKKAPAKKEPPKKEAAKKDTAKAHGGH